MTVVVASGGEVAVESGGEITTESGGVKTIESGGKITAESGGEGELQSGGFFDIQGGASARVVGSGTAVTASQMRDLLWRQTQLSIIQGSTGAGSGVLSVINLPSCGHVFISMSGACSKASAWLTSMNGIVGQMLMVKLRGSASTAQLSLFMSGCSVEGTTSGFLSCILLITSDVSQAHITFVCTAEDEWSILDKSDIGGVTEQADV